MDGVGIGQLIRVRRLELGWSQDQLAAELRRFRPTVTRDEVKKWEWEKIVPGALWLGHLATVLAKPVEDLDAAANLSRMRRRAFLALTGLTAVSKSLVADIMASTASGDYTVMRDVLTPYAVDMSLARVVRGDRATIRRLQSWMRDGETAKLRVNAASILWKTSRPDLIEAAPRQLYADNQARAWYLKSHARRVLRLPWRDAEAYTGRAASPEQIQRHVRELKNQLDPGNRWCAAVFLGQATQAGDQQARRALTASLRAEPVPENVRMIGLSLAGELPWEAF